MGSDPTDPPMCLLTDIAGRIQSCCGHTALKSHRLAWGWTAARAVEEFHRMCERNGYERRGLARRSWLEWEAGRPPNRSYQDLVCQLFSTGPVQLGFATDYTPGDAVGVAAASDDTDESEGVWRDEAMVDADEARLFVRRVTTSMVHELTLDHIELAARRLASDFVSQPLVAIEPPLRDLRAEVFSWVDSCRAPGQLRRLYRAAGQLCGLVGHVRLDQGAYGAAGREMELAWLCADLAGDDSLKAWIRSVESLIAYWDGDARQAAVLARDGSRFARSGSILVRLPALEARALSAVGDVQGAVSALARAEAMLEANGDDDEVGLFHFPAAKQAAYAGTTLLGTGDPSLVEQALAASRRAIHLYETGPATQRSSGDVLAARFDLAMGHLAAGEPDGALDELRGVFVVPSQYRTSSVLKRGDRLRERLVVERYAASVVGVELCAALDGFCQPHQTMGPEHRSG